MRGISLILSFLLIFSLFTPYGIILTKADPVYFDNSYLNLSFDPATIVESGFVYLTFTLKKEVYDNLDFIFGFNTTNMKPRYMQIWRNMSHVYTVQEYNNKTVNGTVYHINTGSHEIIEWFFDWDNVQKDFVVYNMNYENMTKWYSLEDINILVNRTYKVRIWVDVKINTGGKYWFVIKPTSLTFHEAYTNNKFFALDPWFDSNWDYRASAWVDHTKIDTNLIDFPCAFFINSTICDTYTKKNLSDLRFYAADNITAYDWQIEYNVSGQTRVIWVRIPYIYDSDYTLVNVYFGYSGPGNCANTSNVTNIWLNSKIKSSYLLNDPVGSLKDNKRFIYFTNRNTPTFQQTGKQGLCVYIDADNDYFDAASNFSVYNGGGFSYWFKGTGDNGEGALSIPYSASGSAWQGIFNANGTIRMKTLNTAGTESEMYSTGGISLFNGAWIHLALIYDKNATTQYLYVNGSLVMWKAQTLNIRTIYANTFLGAFSASYKTAANSLHAYFDTLIMYSEPVNSSWIKAEYNSGMNTLLIWGNINGKNSNPTITNPSPGNESTDINLNPQLMATVIDPDMDNLNVTFYTNASGAWVNIGVNNTVASGSICRQYTFVFTVAYKKYWWMVTAFDGISNISAIFSFTTREVTPPDQSFYRTHNISIWWYVNISDNFNLFSFNISCNNSQYRYLAGQNNGTFYIFLFNLTFVNYTITVSVNDSAGNWNNKTYYLDLNLSSVAGSNALIAPTSKLVIGIFLGGVMFSVVAITIFGKRRGSNK